MHETMLVIYKQLVPRLLLGPKTWLSITKSQPTRGADSIALKFHFAQVELKLSSGSKMSIGITASRQVYLLALHNF